MNIPTKEAAPASLDQAPIMEPVGSTFGYRNKLVMSMATGLAAVGAVVGLAKFTGSAEASPQISDAKSYLADRCGGYAPTAEVLVAHWRQKGILDDPGKNGYWDDVVGYYKIPTVDETPLQWVKNHFGRATLADDAVVENTGCLNGKIVPVGDKILENGTTEWVRTGSLQAEFPDGFSLIPRKGYIRVKRVVGEGASDESSNPRKGREVPIYVYIPIEKPEKPEKPVKPQPQPKTSSVFVRNICETPDLDNLGDDGSCPSDTFNIKYRPRRGGAFTTVEYNPNPYDKRGMKVGSCTVSGVVNVVTISETMPKGWQFWVSEKAKNGTVTKSQICKKGGVFFVLKKNQVKLPPTTTTTTTTTPPPAESKGLCRDATAKMSSNRDFVFGLGRYEFDDNVQTPEINLDFDEEDKIDKNEIDIAPTTRSGSLKDIQHHYSQVTPTGEFTTITFDLYDRRNKNNPSDDKFLFRCPVRIQVGPETTTTTTPTTPTTTQQPPTTTQLPPKPTQPAPPGKP